MAALLDGPYKSSGQFIWESTFKLEYLAVAGERDGNTPDTSRTF